MNLIHIITRIPALGLVFLHSQYCRIFRTPKLISAEINNCKDILIINPGGIGDGALTVDAVNETMKMYPKEKGYQIYVLCSEPVKQLYKEVPCLKDIILLEPTLYSKTSKQNVYRKYIDIYQQINSHSFVLVWYTMRPAFFGMCLLSSVNASKKIGVVPDREYNFVRKYLISRAYTETVPTTIDEFQLNDQRKVLHALGNREYKSKCGFIPNLITENPARHDRYIIIHMGSSRTANNWEPQKFAQLINTIVAKYKIHIYLIGNTEEQKILNNIKDELNNKEFIHSYLGKTNLTQWIELIRGAFLLIGNDSGAVHVAAAVRTPSIVILGGWHYGNIHPYNPDFVRESDCLPVCVYNKQTTWCYGCASRTTTGQKHGHENKQCAQEVSLGKPVLCIQEITVDDVLDKVGSFLSVTEGTSW